MTSKKFIPLNVLCTHYNVEMSFFSSLSEIGLIKIKTIEQASCVHQDRINDIEKMIRMYRELDVNIEGIDVAFNLLQKIDDLQNELIAIKNRLQMYEN